MKSLLSLTFGLALLTAGCGAATSEYMRPLGEGAPPPAAKADTATVVFIRHSGMAKKAVTTILDEGGHFVGDSTASSYFAREVPAGKHMFITWAENTDFLTADVQAGKVYYVEVDPSMGAWSARFHLFAVKPGSKQWSELQDWLKDNKQFSVDVQSGEAYLQGRAKDVQERLRRANDAASKEKGEDLDKRTLGPNDTK